MTLSTSRLWFVPGLAAFLLLALLPPAPVCGQTLGQWTPSLGPRPDYEAGGNPEAKHGSPGGAYIRSIVPATSAIGSLKSELPAGPYVGKRVRLSGFLKTENAEDGAMFSISVEDPNGVRLASDGMGGRLVVGTSDWTKCDLVVDVPTTSSTIKLAVGLFGAGKAWADGVALDVLGSDVPLTNWPGKWTTTGSAPQNYEMGGDPSVAHGSAAGGYIRAKPGAAKGFGALATWCVPSNFIGKRVRLSAFVRTEAVEGAAALFLSASGAHDSMLGFDNMDDRPIKGTTGWTRYEAVVDVPSGTTILGYGFFVDGAGAAWIDGVTLEPVGPEVALTGQLAWSAFGSNPGDYEMGGNPRVARGAGGGGYIRSKVEAPRPYGAWVSGSVVGPFLGKRVRLSGYVKTEAAQKAAVYMRVDGPDGRMLSFDNMDNRPIRGATDWKKYDVVLDVPRQAVGLSYGLILAGRGMA